MRELSLHILDIAENGIRAGADYLLIQVEESSADDRLSLSVEDNGRGMPAEKIRRSDDPFVTTRKARRVGLGISLLASAARRCKGDLSVEVRREKGTRVTATFCRSHIDRAPLGDMAATMEVLIMGNPHIDFHYIHRVDGKEFVLDTRDLKTELGELFRSDPNVIHHLTESIRRSLVELAVGSQHAPPRRAAMPKLTVEDLKRIKQKTATAMALRLAEPSARITVHMGTCGIAAGAREVMQALLSELSASNRSDVRVLAAGCMGNCASEPNVTVAVQGSEPVVYQKMDPAKIQQVFQRHILAGEVQREFVLSP